MVIMTRQGAKFWWKKELPSNVHHFYKNRANDIWQEHTWQDIFKKRTEKQEASLRGKRRVENIMKPCGIWVFYNDPKKCNFFTGWYIYIRTTKKDYALNFRNPRTDIILKLMELFPLGILPCKENIYEWVFAFYKAYPLPNKKKRKEGFTTAWCSIKNDRIIDVFKNI